MESRRGRRMLVTGSNRGIGLELARQYSRSGYDVIATCRDPTTASELRAIEPGVDVSRLDVSSEPDLDTLVTQLAGVPIDVLICNAAVFGTRSRFENLDFDVWRSVLEVNVLGSVRVAMRLWENVAASEERKIVFISSRAGLPREAKPGASYAYASSKAALHAAARCLALDLIDKGVVVALLNPGRVKSGIGGAHAPMTAADSVAKMTKVIAELTPAHAGRFLHFDGTELPL